MDVHRTDGSEDEERRGSAWLLLSLWSAASLVSVLLAACGGGGGGGPAVSADQTPPPVDGPDLVAEAVTLGATTVSAGAGITVTDRVANQGPDLAGPFSVAIYLSADDVIDDGDRLLGYRSLAALVGEGTSTGGGTVTIPADTTPGTWRVGVVADEFDEVEELDETNNWRIADESLEVTPSLLPDLRAVSVSFGGSTLQAGQSLEVTDLVENAGTGAAGAFVVGIHLSQDPHITPSDPMIGVRAVPGLAPGAESLASGAITIPLTTAPGTWYVGTVVDPQDDVTESDEFDNSAVAPTLLQLTQPPLPDLAVDQLSFGPLSVDIGSTIEIVETVTNTGLGASPPVELGVFLSEDTLVAINDRLIGRRTVPALAVGESSTVTSVLVMPADVPAGDYHVGVIADHLGVLPELAEANNALLSPGLLTVVVPPLPDLAMTGFSFSPGVVTAGTGATLSISDTVENKGVLAAGSFRVAFYLSTNTAIGSSDLLIGSRTVVGLAPGESSTGVTDVPIPSTIPGGSWFVGALADDLDVILEPTQGNNAIFSPGALDVVSSPDPMPDLEMKHLTFTPDRAVPGATIQFQDQVRNIGTLSSGTFHVGVYLSEDDEVTTDDLLLAERIVFNLSIDFGSASSFQAQLPDDLAVGDWFVAAIADNRDVVTEGDEDNNVYRTVGGLEVFVPPPPMPDLEVASLSFTPAAGTGGDLVSVSDTVRNAGNLDATGPIRVAFFLSEDDVITSDDTAIGSRIVGALAAGETSSGTTQLTLPSGLTAGDWYVGAVVDELDVVTESDEDDNAFAAPTTLEIQ